MKQIPNGYIETSSMFSLKRVKHYIPLHEATDYKPEAGDVLYGKISVIRQHKTLENKIGRIHHIHDNTKAIFVLGNRYAPDYYEALVPEELNSKIDLIARSGLVGQVINKNDKVQEPTQVKIFGYVCNSDGEILNTVKHSSIKHKINKTKKNKLILSVGTNMNSGKTTSAAMCCWCLNKAGHNVTASKITGTASLKDILLMQDSGASKISDFTYFGHPSTYMLDKDVLIDLFKQFDNANNETYWVVEFADGILQRETRFLLEDEYIKNRVYKTIFNAHDTFSAIGGIQIMKEELGYDIDAISGVVSGSPLLIKELRQYSNIPVINSFNQNSFKELLEVIV